MQSISQRMSSLMSNLLQYVDWLPLILSLIAAGIAAWRALPAGAAPARACAHGCRHGSSVPGTACWPPPTAASYAILVAAGWRSGRRSLPLECDGTPEMDCEHDIRAMLRVLGAI
jgi:hypothetical protein